jgi:uncharacterized membrane protein YecN with MAPEG domain
VKYLLGSLVVLSVLDAILTHFLVRLNLATESNYFLASMTGEPVFFVVKFFGALIAAFILWDISRKHRRLGLTATLCSVAVYSLIVLWNMSLFIVRRPA